MASAKDESLMLLTEGADGGGDAEASTPRAATTTPSRRPRAVIIGCAALCVAGVLLRVFGTRHALRGFDTSAVVEDFDFLVTVEDHGVFVKKQPYLFVLCHSMQTDDTFQLPKGKQFVSYTDRGKRLRSSDAYDAIAKIQAEGGAKLPEEVGGMGVKLITGESVTNYPCQGDDDLYSSVWKMNGEGTTTLLKRLRSSDCFSVKEDLFKMMDTEGVDLLVFLGCKSEEEEKQEDKDKEESFAGKECARSEQDGQGEEWRDLWASGDYPKGTKMRVVGTPEVFWSRFAGLAQGRDYKEGQDGSFDKWYAPRAGQSCEVDHRIESCSKYNVLFDDGKRMDIPYTALQMLV